MKAIEFFSTRFSVDFFPQKYRRHHAVPLPTTVMMMMVILSIIINNSTTREEPHLQSIDRKPS
jgi:multisubunit Na+/H+ antiporter MnhG subunit